MPTTMGRTASLIALALSFSAPAPARAGDVLCENVLCMVVVYPFVFGIPAITELTRPAQPYELALKAIRQGKTQRLQQILRDNPSLAADADKGLWLLSETVESGNLEYTQLLVKAGALPQREGSRLLLSATSTEMMAYLISGGAVPADVNLANFSVNASRRNSPALLSALLDARGALDANDPGAQALLRKAAGARHGPIVKLLTQRGVNPNTGPSSILLELSYYCGIPSSLQCGPDAAGIARDLIAAGAQVKVVDNQGRSAVALARQVGYLELAKVLEDAGG